MFTTDDLIGFGNVITTSRCVAPAAIALPTDHAKPPGKLLVVTTNVAVPASAAVDVRMISMPVI